MASWSLIAKTASGWKKYRDSGGNLRYQRPDGRFASQQQYAGSLSHADETPVDGRDRDTGTDSGQSGVRSGTVISTPEWDFEDYSDNTDLHETAHNYCIDEGIPIEEYPINERLTQLERKTKNENRPEYRGLYWSLECIVYEESGMKIKSFTWRRRTSLKIPGLVNELKEEFSQHYRDSLKLVDSYKEVIVTETCIHFRK